MARNLYLNMIAFLAVLLGATSHCYAERNLLERFQKIVASNATLHTAAERTLADSPYQADTLAGQLWIEQAFINGPLLSIAAAIVHQRAQGQLVAFVTRDGVHLQQIYETLYPDDATLRFAVSRIASYNPSDSFLEYAGDIFRRRPLIVDIHGSGASLQHLGRRLGIQPNLFNLMASSTEIPGVVQTQRGFWIETLNRDLCGTLYDYVDGMELRHPIEYSYELATIQHAAMHTFIGHLKHLHHAVAADQHLFKQIATAAESTTLASNRYLGWQAIHITRSPLRQDENRSWYRDPSLDKGYRLIQHAKPKNRQKRVSSERRKNRQPGPGRAGRGRLE